jgi:hypothetical protein
MQFAYLLSMPGAASWNGKWSGEGRIYAIVENVTSQKAIAKRTELVGHHSYGFSDGWRASVEVKQVDPKEARALRKASQGFCGYDWMVDSLKSYGKIYDTSQIKAMLLSKRFAPAEYETLPATVSALQFTQELALAHHFSGMPLPCGIVCLNAALSVPERIILEGTTYAVHTGDPKTTAQLPLRFDEWVVLNPRGARTVMPNEVFLSNYRAKAK